MAYNSIDYINRLVFLPKVCFCVLQIFTRFGKVLKIVTFTKNSKYSVLQCIVVVLSSYC